MPATIPHSEPWRLSGLNEMKTHHTYYACEFGGQGISVAKLTFPHQSTNDGHIIKPYFTGCLLYEAFSVTMDEEVLSALRSLCSFLGVTLEECILTCFSLGGGVEPMQLIISQSLRAVRGLMAELNRATIQPRVEIPVDVPAVVPETSEICVAALIGITQALQHNVGEVGNRINDVALDLTRKMEAHTTSMLANNVSMLEAFYDRLLNFSLKTDVTKCFDDLEMSQYATLNMVNNKTEAIKDLRIKSLEYCKQLAHLEEWKLSATARMEKLEELAIQNAAFAAETKVLIAQQAAALEDSKQQQIKMEFHITKLKQRVSTLDIQGSAVEAPAPAPIISRSADSAAQVPHATFTPLSKKT
jgi:hypothetical protein